MPKMGLGLGLRKTKATRRFQGLLDLFPGAQFVTSTSLLRYDLYDSWLQQIRRSSDNDAVLAKPDLSLAIPAISLNSLLVNGAGTLGQFVGSGSGFVAASREQALSGVGDPVQADITKQPRIISNGVLETLDGKPAMVFDGVDDGLTTPATNFTGDDLSLFFATSTDVATTDFRTLIDYKHTDPPSNWEVQTTSSADGYYLAYWNGSQYEAFGVVASFAQGEKNILSIIKNGTSIKHYINNGLAASASGATGNATIVNTIAPIAIGYTVGVGRYFKGKVRSVVVYNEALSEGQNQAIRNILY